jgi:hypothetical protein
VLPRWYYIFSLHDRPSASHARTFVHRYETKTGVYSILRKYKGASSPTSDKLKFAEHCQSHRLPVVPVLAVARDGRVSGLADGRLPECDLFVKPLNGRGGKGAERWNWLGEGRYRHASGVEMTAEGLLDRLARESSDTVRIVQPRITNCESLADLNNGALSTVRVLTCLDEQDRPECVAAVVRMAINDNQTVDNIHSGGMAANICLESGVLGPASDLGANAALGWCDRHPNSGGQIAGRALHRWAEVRDLALQAHRAFDDRVCIGWDIAITPDGPVIVEGNGGPDVDLMQRPARRGLMDGRFGELLAHHLRKAAAARN